MLSVLSGILGFATSGLPSVLKFFEQKGDNAHEEAMAKLEMERALAMAEKGFKSQEKIEELKTDQVSMDTYTQERVALYKNDEASAEGASTWVINLRASVRPIITYVFVIILLVVDFVGLYWAISTGTNYAEAMKIIFSNEEMAILASIIGFWFGSRHWEK